MSPQRAAGASPSPWRATVVVAGLLIVASVTPLATPQWRGTATSILTALLVVVLLFGRPHHERPGARRFWDDLTLAAISALAVHVALRFVHFDAVGVLAPVLADSLFVGYYLGFALAVERKPERVRPPLDPDTGRWTRPAAIAFVLGAFGYFVVLPALLLPPQLYRESLTNQTFFATLDGYLFARLLHRAIGARGRWRRIYVLLAITAAAGFVMALLRLGGADLPRLSSALWYVPVSAFLLAAHERRRPQLEAPQPADPSFWPRSGDQAMLLALAAPVIHFSLYPFGRTVDLGLQAPRELLLLVWTIALGTIAVLQRRALEHKALEMLTQRESLTTRLGTAASDLRMIVEHRSAAHSLSATETKLARALEVCPDAIGISTLVDGRFFDVNPAFEALTGFRREEILERTSSQLGIWLDPAHRQAIVEAVRRQGHARDLELPIRVSSGGQRRVLFSAQPLDLGGEACLIIVGRDVTALRAIEAEAAMRARLLAAVRDAVYSLDANGRIHYWNRGAERLYRWLAAEAEGEDAAGLLFPYEPAPLLDAQSATLATGQWHGPLRPSTRTGAPIVVLSRWTRLERPEDGDAVLVVDTDQALLDGLREQERDV